MRTSDNTVVGRVSSAGVVLFGTGFSVQRVGAGNYTLFFDKPFRLGSVMIVVNQQQWNFSLVDLVTDSSCRIMFSNPAASALQDTGFMFTAYGQ